MKAIPTIVFLLVLNLFSSGFLWAGDDSHDIALNLDIPGKGGWRTCDIFAKDLYKRMTAAGGEAHYIIYDWSDDHFAGRHSFVVYRDSEGRYWGTDQQQNHPRWLSGKSDAEWAELFAANYDTQVVYSHSDTRLAGQYADLHRAPPMFADPGLIASLPGGNMSTEAARTAVVKATAPVAGPDHNLFAAHIGANPGATADADVMEQTLIRGSLFRVSDTFRVR